MTSFESRNTESFLRNSLYCEGSYTMPLIIKQPCTLNTLTLLGFHRTKSKEAHININKTIHFFIDDYKFERVWNHPNKYIARLKQYPQILSPDFSVYTNMPKPLQIYNVFRNRWCGAFYQKNGLSVIPTITWGDKESYSFCFSGVETNSVVAISTVGARKNSKSYMNGFREMCFIIKPQKVICYGEAFREMHSLCDIIGINYADTCHMYTGMESIPDGGKR